MASSTLRRRLYSLVFLWIAIISVAAVVTSQSSLARMRDVAVEERMLLAESLAHALDAQLSHLFGDLRQLSAELRPPFEEQVDRLRALRFGIPFRRAVYVLDEAGAVVVADPHETRPIGREWLQGKEAVTPALPARAGARPIAAIIQPFGENGHRLYLVAEMDLEESGVDAVLRSLTASRDLRLFVMDLEGRVLASGDPGMNARQLPPRESARLATSRPAVLTDAACYFCDSGGASSQATIVVPLEIAPWRLVVQEEASRVFAAARWSRLNLFGALAVIGSTGVLLSWSLSRTVVHPLRRLSSQAERLREGDLSVGIGVEAHREISLLAETLDDARRKLADSLGELEALNESLEGQVEVRTREIRQLLDRTRAQDAKRRALVRRLLSAGEEERRRIARELHDEISQLLTVVLLALEGIPGADARIEQAKELLARTQREIKRIISDLRPSLLDDLGLSLAVRGHAKDFLGGRGLAVNLEVEEDLDLPSEVETTAFRIYQEIATNIVRHSGAENVAIELYVEDDVLTLSVEDDGVGFVPSDRAGTGIHGMQERARLVGGTIEIESAPGTGTHVRFRCSVEESRQPSGEAVSEGAAEEP